MNRVATSIRFVLGQANPQRRRIDPDSEVYGQEVRVLLHAKRRVLGRDSCDLSFLLFRGPGEGEGPISSPSAGFVTVIEEASPSVAHYRGTFGAAGPGPGDRSEGGPSVGTPSR
jgi:hypothetical protein